MSEKKPIVGFDVKIRNLDKVLANLDAVPEEVRKAIIAHHHWAAPFLHREVVKLASGKIIKRRTGRYIRSIRHLVDDAKLTARVGTKLKYAAMREFGHKRLRAKRSKIGLAIPLKGAKTKAGASKSPRDYTNTFFVRRKSDGTIFLFGKRTPKAKKIVPLFVFKKQVKQEPGLIFSTAFDKSADKITSSGTRRIARGFQKALESAQK